MQKRSASKVPWNNNMIINNLFSRLDNWTISSEWNYSSKPLDRKSELGIISLIEKYDYVYCTLQLTFFKHPFLN
jgi:hypothetical protein